jgi:hypothetical protein
LTTNHLSDATQEFQTALKLGDSQGRAQHGLAFALIGQSKFETALPHVLVAVEADQNDAEKLVTLLVGSQGIAIICPGEPDRIRGIGRHS